MPMLHQLLPHLPLLLPLFLLLPAHNVVDAAAPSTAAPPTPAPALHAATFILMYTLISLIRIGRVA